MEESGVMENGGVLEESGVMQKDPFVAKGKVTEKAGAMEKSEKMVENSSVVAAITEQQTAAVHVCEVCGTYFETRRGLSSHARSHLRQLGVCVSESSGAPISLLYELITERDGALPFTHKHTYTHSNTTKHATHSQHRVKHTVKHGIKHTVKHGIKHTVKHGIKHTVKHGIKQGIKHGVKHTVKRTIKHGSGTKLKIKIGELVKRPCVSVPAALRDSSSSASSFPSSFSSSSSPLHHHKPLKPPRTPPALEDSQKTDPSLELKEMSGVSQRDCVHVCELCGAWYETKKGLASHVRIHLHHYGVALEPKAPPIQVLHDLLQKKAGPVGQDTATALLTPPPLKKSKLSPAKKKTPRDSDSSKIVNCEFCGENFKKTQSLASHARSHLRQLGVTDWTAHGSPMATLRELMARRSCSSLLQSTQTTPFTPPQANPMSEAMPTLATGPTFVRVPNPPSEAPPTLAPCATPVQMPNPPSEALPTPAPCAIPVRVPKAKKGWRMAVSKPKDEPVELDISNGQPTKLPPVKSPTDQSATDYTTAPANQNPQVEVGMAKPVKCDFCDDLFDSRKALSCHARGHLRQLGVKWAPCASPIDTLQQLMIREGRGQDSVVTPLPVDTCREKTETDGAACEATCELCGFDFENRKALASHARAHLRQQGEQWSSSQSPIAALSLWMNREPEKVAALHQLYMQGTLPQIRKRRACSPFRSSYADSARSGVSRPSPAARQGKTGAGLVCSSSSQRKLSSHRPAPHSAVEHGSVRQSSKLFSFRREGAESLKRVGNAPSLVPRPPETSLVKLVGKIYSLKCRFCEQVFSGPLSVQEDWLIHLRHHILNLKPDHARGPAPISPHSESAHLIGQAV